VYVDITDQLLVVQDDGDAELRVDQLRLFFENIKQDIGLVVRHPVRELLADALLDPVGAPGRDHRVPCCQCERT